MKCHLIQAALQHVSESFGMNSLMRVFLYVSDGDVSLAGTLLELAKHLLGIENMAVILLNENHEVTPMATGFITPGAKSRAHGSKQWLLVPSLDQTVIVEDTFQDPRQVMRSIEPSTA